MGKNFNEGRTGSAYLFPAQPPSAPGSATSREAAEKFKRIAGKRTREVLEAFAIFIHDGATRDQVHVECKIPIPTVTSRANYLVRVGALEATGEERKTSSGYPAEVLRITPHGGAMLLQAGE